jgi:hypothetical protein
MHVLPLSYSTMSKRHEENDSVRNGGDDEIRTHDLCSAIAALSQLSYTPGGLIRIPCGS